jgi:hypothetical protein
MLARVDASSATPSAAAIQPASTRKMGDHLVIVCAGGELHQGAGYRDFPARIPRQPAEPQFARAPFVIGRR